MCQSFAKPSLAEYWHMGETPMRLAKVTERSWSGEKRGRFMVSKACDEGWVVSEWMRSRQKRCKGRRCRIYLVA